MDSPQNTENDLRMNAPDTATFNMDRLESLARGDSFIHRLDARAKMLVTLGFLVSLLSLPSLDLFGITAFLLYPIVTIALADIPGMFLFKRSLLALPFVVFIGILNPFFDHSPAVELGGITITGGWISFFVIIARGILSVLCVLILTATTGMANISKGFKQLGVPGVITTQLIFIFRYIFILANEASSMLLSARLRNSSSRPLSFSIWRNMVGSLLLRSLNRSERMYSSLLCRGFDGNLQTLNQQHFGKKEWIYLLAWTGIFVFLRFFDPVRLLGNVLHTSLPS